MTPRFPVRKSDVPIEIAPTIAARSAPISGSATNAMKRCGVRYEPICFTATKSAFINAAVDLLIPFCDEGHDGIEAGVSVFTGRQMETPYGNGVYWYIQAPVQPDAPATLGYRLGFMPRELYQLGIAAVDRASRKANRSIFADLDCPAGDKFLFSLGKNGIAHNGTPAISLFSRLLTNTQEGYPADPMYGGNRGMAAWKMIRFPALASIPRIGLNSRGALRLRRRRHRAQSASSTAIGA
jgi:gluconate 2-dehydrogenase gamma chain